MNALLLIFSVFCTFFACGLMRRDFCRNDVKNVSDLFLFNGLTNLFSAAALTVIALATSSTLKASPYTLFMGVAFGLITAFCALCDMKALETGPLSYTSIIVSCSMVIPAFSGLLFFHEPVSVFQYIGAVFMIFAFIFAVDSKSNGNGTSLKWFLFCIGSFLLNGGIGIMQKIHQSSAFKEELSAFLVIAFLVSALFSFCSLTVLRKKAGLTITEKSRLPRLFLYGVVCGTGIALCNHINMYLSGVLPSIIFFPVVNGGYMLLTTLCGLLFFKEKLTFKQFIGLIAGAAAILLLCIQVQA